MSIGTRIADKPMVGWRLFLLWGLLCVIASFPLRADRIPVDGYAAMVNQRVITIGEVMAAMQPLERQLRLRHSGRELATRLEEAYEQVLSTMIEHALMLEEFQKREGDIPRQVVDEQVQSIIAENFGGDRGLFLQQLAQEGMTLEDWREEIRDRLIVMMMRGEEVTPKVIVSPRQIRAAYEDRIDEYRKQSEMRVRMIMLQPEPREDGQTIEALTKTILREVAAGTSFADAARRYSEDARAARGGDWGWINPEILRAELAAAVEELEIGGIAAPVNTPEAVYVVQVADRRDESVTPFAEVRDELAADVRRAEEERIYRAWIRHLKHQHHVQRYELGAVRQTL